MNQEENVYKNIKYWRYKRHVHTCQTS